MMGAFAVVYWNGFLIIIAGSPDGARDWPVQAAVVSARPYFATSNLG
jgi:hypothetical protein